MAWEQQTRRRGFIPGRHAMKVRLTAEQHSWLNEQALRSGGWGIAAILRHLVDAARLPAKETADG
jgi:hypothetical protein